MSVLIACRKEAGLTQAQLGKRCGRDQAWVSAIETGQRDVGVAEFIQLARAFGMEPQTLFQRYLAFLPPAPPKGFTSTVQLEGAPVQSGERRAARPKRVRRR